MVKPGTGEIVMPRKMKDFIASLPAKRQQRIKERSEELLQEHMALQE